MDQYSSKFNEIFNLKSTNEEKHVLQKISTINRNQCRKCDSQSLFNDQINANRVCANCGFINAKLFNSEAEWRYYGYADDNKHNDPTRCGLPVDELLPKSSLTTRIKYVGSKYVSLVRLHKWNVIHPEERSLFTVFKYIDKILMNTNISNTAIMQAKEYYKILSEKDNRRGTLTRGIIRKSFISACIYVSCKNNGTPIQKGEIARICGIDRFCITKGFKKFSRLEQNKNIQLNKPTNNNENMHNFIHKFCIKLNYSTVMEDIAHIICNRLGKLKILQDTNDISISAGLLYFIAMLFYENDEYRQKILDIIDTSIVTLQKVYKILRTNKRYILIGLHQYIIIDPSCKKQPKKRKKKTNKDKTKTRTKKKKSRKLKKSRKTKKTKKKKTIKSKIR